MAIYLKANGIQGNATAKGYEQWVELSSLDFDISSKTRMPVGSARERSRGAPEFSEFIFTKNLDNASNPLFQHACTQKVLPIVEIHICSTDANLTPVAKYKLSNTMVTSHKSTSASGAAPLEVGSLHFTKIECTYIGRDATNQQQAPQISGYNLETAEPM